MKRDGKGKPTVPFFLSYPIRRMMQMNYVDDMNRHFPNCIHFSSYIFDLSDETKTHHETEQNTNEEEHRRNRYHR